MPDFQVREPAGDPLGRGLRGSVWPASSSASASARIALVTTTVSARAPRCRVEAAHMTTIDRPARAAWPRSRQAIKDAARGRRRRGRQLRRRQPDRRRQDDRRPRRGSPRHAASPTSRCRPRCRSRSSPRGAGFTDATGTKGGMRDPRLLPDAVIYDAELTLDTPMQLWLSTGIRALDHAVEGFLAEGDHPFNDVMALEAIRRLFDSLPRAKARAEGPRRPHREPARRVVLVHAAGSVGVGPEPRDGQADRRAPRHPARRHLVPAASPRDALPGPRAER